MHLGLPQPQFANQSLVLVESGWMLVTTVMCDMSLMLTLFCIGSVNRSSVSTGWSHDVTVNQLEFGYAYRTWLLYSDGTIWSWGKTMDTIRYCTKYRDTIRYDTIRYTAPKRSAICNGQQSKINAAFSLTPSHAFACIQTPSTVDGIRTLSITFGSVRTWGTVLYQKSSINRFK